MIACDLVELVVDRANDDNGLTSEACLIHRSTGTTPEYARPALSNVRHPATTRRTTVGRECEATGGEMALEGQFVNGTLMSDSKGFPILLDRS